MPIRWRLTLWFALILCGILVLAGSVLYFVLQSYLINEVDINLRVYSAEVHGTLEPEEIPDPLDYSYIHSKLPPIDEFTSPRIFIQVKDRDGNVVLKSDSLGERELPTTPELVAKGLNGTVDVETVAVGDGTPVRIMVSPLFLKERTLLLEVAQSLGHVETTMRQVIVALVISVLLALILAGISGAFLVRRALSPVNHITRIARSIGESYDLARRVGYKGPSDEIAHLANTFDYMIEQLDKIFKSQQHFIADASHELRGPLTVIQGNLDLFRHDLGEEDRQESLREIREETIVMAKIVTDLLVLAEVESGQIERQEMISLKDILLDSLEMAKQLAGNRKIVVERQDNISIKGDAHRLKQLFRNLLENAIRYTTDEGTIILSLFKDGDWARLDMSDDGIGIAPEHLPHIFNRFYRADKARSRARGGTGLGLAIVKEIVEQHGGRVTVVSEPDRGSTFTVWLKY